MFLWSGICVFCTLRSGLPQQVYKRALSCEWSLPGAPSTLKSYKMYMNLGSPYFCVVFRLLGTGFLLLLKLHSAWQASGEPPYLLIHVPGRKNVMRNSLPFRLFVRFPVFAPHLKQSIISINFCLTCFHDLRCLLSCICTSRCVFCRDLRNLRFLGQILCSRFPAQPCALI